MSGRRTIINRLGCAPLYRPHPRSAEIRDDNPYPVIQDVERDLEDDRRGEGIGSAAESTSAQTDAVRSERASANAAIVRHLFEETLGSGNLIVTTDALAPEYVGQVDGMPDLPHGPAGFKRFVARVRRVLFDLDVTIDGVVARCADVVVRWTASVRQERPFQGLEPTCVFGDAGQEPGGRQMTISAVTIARVEDSKIQESRTEWTSLAVK